MPCAPPRRLLQLCHVPEAASGCVLASPLKALLLYLDHGVGCKGERKQALVVGRGSALEEGLQQHTQVGGCAWRERGRLRLYTYALSAGR